jgi:hypothetical protein
MDLEQFGRLLVLHGANLNDWPQAERLAAERLLAWSPPAARLRDEAARADSVLRDAGPRVSAAAVERLLIKLDAIPTMAAEKAGDEPDRVFFVPPRRVRAVWLPAAVMAAMVVIGFLIGAVASPSEPRQASDLVDLLKGRSSVGFDL